MRFGRPGWTSSSRGLDATALEHSREHTRCIAFVPGRVRARCLHETAEQIERLGVVNHANDALFEVRQDGSLVAVHDDII